MIVADFRLSLIVTILFALCIEAGIFMLIAHWWGNKHKDASLNAQRKEDGNNK